MKIEQYNWNELTGWQYGFPGNLGKSAQLVLIFGVEPLLGQQHVIEDVVKAYPRAKIFGCSTAAAILNNQMLENSLGITAISLKSTSITGACVKISEVNTGFDVGERLAKSLNPNGLVHAFVLADGFRINGNELIRGITKNLPEGVTITGGLACNSNMKAQESLIIYNGSPEYHSAVIIGFYGDGLSVGFGSQGGWDPFGPDRLITKSHGNILYELDGRSALDLYKQYIGESADFSASVLSFPLGIRINNDETRIVRACLSTSEENKSMTFAGDVPAGCYARLMKANFNHLIDGASGATKTSCEAIGNESPELAILVSCVARKIVLRQRVEEEIETVRDITGEATAITGFYSYGEIAPLRPGADCDLHNQTMTITTFREQ